MFVITFFIQLILSMEKAIKHRTQKQRESVISFLIQPIHSAGKTWGTDRLGEGTLPESLKCPRPRSSLRVSFNRLLGVGVRFYWCLVVCMFPNDLLHPDHIIPPVKLIPAILESPAKPEPKMLMELGTVLI